jgi:hypothetical protein
MKLTTERPFANPEAAARKLVELASGIEPVQDGRIYIELINYPMLFKHKATADEYKAGLDLAVERGWLELHESGTYVRLLKTEAANRGGLSEPHQNALHCPRTVAQSLEKTNVMSWNF